MLDFKNITKIVTHGGAAHRDDFLSVSFVLAMCAEADNTPIVVRRDPTQEEITDKNVVVIDVGGVHDPSYSNFDHHQFERDYDPMCSITLILTEFGIYTQAFRGFRWLDSTEKFDSKGPYYVANEINVNWSDISDLTFSPIEEAILFMFSKLDNDDASSYNFMISSMTQIGALLIRNLEMFTERWQILKNEAECVNINGHQIVLSRGISGTDDPTYALNTFVSEKYPDAIATVTNDDRGEGLCLYRLNDSDKIDFFKLDGHKAVLFAHKNGFVAKTKHQMNLEELTELFNISFA
jgi:hypothetical protein